MHPLVFVLLLGGGRGQVQTRGDVVDARIDALGVCLGDELRHGDTRGRVYFARNHFVEKTWTDSSPTQRM